MCDTQVSLPRGLPSLQQNPERGITSLVASVHPVLTRTYVEYGVRRGDLVERPRVPIDERLPRIANGATLR
jgi:hypothetical protein